MKDTLFGSTGIVQGRLEVGAINIAVERRQWETEFGGVLAQRLEMLVQGAMVEYEWPHERRWRG